MCAWGVKPLVVHIAVVTEAALGYWWVRVKAGAERSHLCMHPSFTPRQSSAKSVRACTNWSRPPRAAPNRLKLTPAGGGGSGGLVFKSCRGDDWRVRWTRPPTRAARFRTRCDTDGINWAHARKLLSILQHADSAANGGTSSLWLSKLHAPRTVRFNFLPLITRKGMCQRWPHSGGNFDSTNNILYHVSNWSS